MERVEKLYQNFMSPEFIELLRCPETGQRLLIEHSVGGSRSEDWLISEDRLNRYPIHDGIPRFVPESNYADNFGMQWNHFRKTQLDSHSGHPISSERFWRATGWKPEDMKGKWVLDAGCGAGRFAEVVLGTGANVVALDYSRAVDACYANLKLHPNLHVVQGDI
ncbi:MAG: methyltransferase domain-containing protein, partial [Desulfobacteraceae bacterium]|nr:methyltransferase domain-containing protein [Desulfobacteraceae bacterium]